ncbi:MAG: DUF2975 domain-containing protein [Lachnospiraceae bacterium]|jgi:hypothetical protein|nr:DUF2975 domain-containing protein [Lachnospiraceae bacterium]
MTQRSLSRWLKVILGGIGVCGALVYFYMVPYFGKEMLAVYPEFSHCYWPWLAVIWVSAAPCYLALFYGWKITVEIGKDHSFSRENAKYLKWISLLAAADSGYFFAANLALLLFGMNHPGIFLASLFVEFAGIAIAAVAAALSHLVQKAALIQEENDLTI